MLHQYAFENRVFWRNRSSVFFTFLMPLFILTLAMLASQSNHKYGRQLIPGIAALGIVSTTFQALAIGLAFHREQGVLKRLRATPLPLIDLIGSKLLVVATVALVEVAIILAYGRFVYDMGWPQDWVLFVAFGVLGGMCFSALGFALASFIRAAESAPALTNAVYFPLMAISGVFYSADTLPRVLSDIAQVFPLYHLVQALHYSYVGKSAEFALHAAVLAAWCVAGVAFTMRRFYWEPSFERA